ncbi:MAG: hypothetical protein RL417_1776 [Pseudomonadota bacterium]
MRRVKIDPQTVMWQLLGTGALLGIVLTWGIAVCARRGHPLVYTLRSIRNLLLPSGVALGYLEFVLDLSLQSRVMRVVETIFWISAIWVALSFIRVVLHEKHGKSTWRSKVPGLFVDLVRFTLVVVGALLVVALVWDGNLTSAFATLGVGSLVLGLALQDTLGNLMAGIALLFERPFQVGDWIKVGDTIGEVIESNWRAVRVQTRSLDSVVIPNSVLGKEKIENYSRPTRAHGFDLEVSFSYQDPPNKVKSTLIECARLTTDILPSGISVRLKAYQDSSILYGTRVFTERFDRLPEIRAEFMTHIWYAARRAGITIPYPIRTVYRTEVPPGPVLDPQVERRDILGRVSLFSALSAEELHYLAESATFVEFAAGEPIVRQGESGQTMYVVRRGRATVSVCAPGSAESKIVAEVGSGDFFGEFAILTGEPRHASVIAVEDIELVAVSKIALERIFEKRPKLVEEIVAVIEARKHGLKLAKELPSLSPAEQHEVERESKALLGSIRRFFRLGGSA